MSILEGLRKALSFSQPWLELSRKASSRRNELGRVQEEAGFAGTAEEGEWRLRADGVGGHFCGLEGPGMQTLGYFRDIFSRTWWLMMYKE